MQKSILLVLVLAVLWPSSAWAADIPLSPLVEKLLTGDAPARQEAVQEFNKLPPDAQYKLVPDFMVALSDDNIEVRRIASRILKAMGVKTHDLVPETRPSSADEKTRPSVSNPSAAPDGIQKEKDSGFAEMRRELELEKRGLVTLNASDLKAGSDLPSPVTLVLDSLKDPDPAIRLQAIRRLDTIHPVPIEAIPALTDRLKDSDAGVRKAAKDALKQIDQPQ